MGKVRAKGRPDRGILPACPSELPLFYQRFLLPRPGIEPGLEVPETSVMSFSLPGRTVRQSQALYQGIAANKKARCVDGKGFVRQHRGDGDKHRYRLRAAPARAIQERLQPVVADSAASALQHQSLRADALDVRSFSDS